MTAHERLWKKALWGWIGFVVMALAFLTLALYRVGSMQGLLFVLLIAGCIAAAELTFIKGEPFLWPLTSPKDLFRKALWGWAAWGLGLIGDIALILLVVKAIGWTLFLIVVVALAAGIVAAVWNGKPWKWPPAREVT